MPAELSENTTPPLLGRRQFIKIAALSGLALGLTGKALDRLLAEGRLKRVSRTALLMGSIANLTLIGDDSPLAERALEAALARMLGMEGVLSRFRLDSQLTQLNTTGLVPHPDRALYTVLRRAVDFAELTGGAFDVTVEPLLRLYRRAALDGRLPNADQVAQARHLADYRMIRFEGDAVSLGKPGMAVTLDGIAKGYVIDEGTRELGSWGFSNVLVEVGGDLHASGSAGGDAWRIGIRPPRRDSGALLGTLGLRDAALATSGDYLNRFSADASQHHIIDPRSGQSPPELSSVSVLAPTACEADALSTSLMILGPEAGSELVDRLPGVEALMVSKQGDIIRSKGFPRV